MAERIEPIDYRNERLEGMYDAKRRLDAEVDEHTSAVDAGTAFEALRRELVEMGARDLVQQMEGTASSLYGDVADTWSGQVQLVADANDPRFYIGFSSHPEGLDLGI